MQKLTLIYHPMCPFAQRILYIINYKAIPVELIEIDMTNRPMWFFEENPSNNFPYLRIETESRKVLIRNSITISEFLERFSGPQLYPVENGKVDIIGEALLKMHFFEIDNIRKDINKIYHNDDFKIVFSLEFNKNLRKISTYVDQGRYFSSSILGKDQLTLIDFMLFPWIERILAFESLELSCYKHLNLFDIKLWFQRIRQLDCIKKSLLPPQCYINLRKQILSGEYKGLVLPISSYTKY